MVARLAELPNVNFRPGTGHRPAADPRDRGARDPVRRHSRLGPAGRRRRTGAIPPMRQALGIGVKTTRYGQKALAFAVTHPIPHQNVSTEIHRSGGPFTLVPLPDRDGLPCLRRRLDGNRTGGRPPGRPAGAEFEAEMTPAPAASSGR